MSLCAAVWEPLTAIPHLSVRRDEPLSEYTRFAIGGPATVLIDTSDSEAFRLALGEVAAGGLPRLVIGGGTNLVVSDSGFDGAVLRYTGSAIRQDGSNLLVQAGAVLQDVVDFSIAAALEGLQTMTGIPGYLGGAVYGNAGAYGHSIQEFVTRVIATDGVEVRGFNNADCAFSYRDSFFKRAKQWTIMAAELALKPGDRDALHKIASGIRVVRDEKYPPSMKCAGSIFKNLLFRQLPESAQSQVPPSLVRDGKVPSAWFLEQTGVKGMRIGDIQVAEYHANLIYNDGAGTATDLVTVIRELKRRVRERFGFDLEEEVQYVGEFPLG